MKRALALALLAAALPASAQPQDPPKPAFPPFKVDQIKVDNAIRKGIEYLKANNAAHTQRFTHAGRQMQHTELVLWTYVHAGVPENDPAFQTLFKDMWDRKLEATYCVSLQAMILEEIERAKYQPRIWQCGQFLVDNQSAAGYWGYGDPTIYAEDPPSTPTGAPARKDVSSGGGTVAKKPVKEFDPLLPPGARVKPPVGKKLPVKKNRDGNPNDNSNTQYAALGIRACHDAGIIIPKEVTEKAIAWYRSTHKAKDPNEPPVKLEQKDTPVLVEGKKGQSGVMDTATPLTADPRGWCYGQHEHKAYGSMTAGSVGGLAIWLYVKDDDGGKKRSWKKDRDVVDGLAWLAKNFSVTYNPGPYEHNGFKENSQDQYYYFLYALERAGMLYGTEWMGAHEWYPEGAKVLIESQGGDGSWGGGAVDTCFAILFLKRATRPLDVATEGSRKRD